MCAGTTSSNQFLSVRAQFSELKFSLYSTNLTTPNLASDPYLNLNHFFTSFDSLVITTVQGKKANCLVCWVYTCLVFKSQISWRWVSDHASLETSNNAMFLLYLIIRSSASHLLVLWPSSCTRNYQSPLTPRSLPEPVFIEQMTIRTHATPSPSPPLYS